MRVWPKQSQMGQVKVSHSRFRPLALETNALAYFFPVIDDKEKMFDNLETRVIKHFTNLFNELKCLSLASLSSLFLCFWVRPGVYLRVGHLYGVSWVGFDYLKTLD